MDQSIVKHSTGIRRHNPANSSELPKSANLAGCRGFGTLEVVIIIAVLMAVALVFRQSLMAFAKHLIDTVFDQDSVIKDLAADRLH